MCIYNDNSFYPLVLEGLMTLTCFKTLKYLQLLPEPFNHAQDDTMACLLAVVLLGKSFPGKTEAVTKFVLTCLNFVSECSCTSTVSG